jgi:hypothetical protein
MALQRQLSHNDYILRLGSNVGIVNTDVIQAIIMFRHCLVINGLSNLCQKFCNVFEKSGKHILLGLSKRE